MEKKTIFLWVCGMDYAATTFKQECDPQKFYEEMIKDGVKQKTLKDGETVITILEFGYVDPSFIDFIKNNLCDYDQLKDNDIFEVKDKKEA